VRYAELTGRIGGEGADAWLTHYAAVAALARGEDVIVLSIGDPDLDTPTPVVERAVERLRDGDTHYTPAAGRDRLRRGIADAHQSRTGQRVDHENVVVVAGAQNGLFIAALLLAGPGDEVITFDPYYTTYPATLEVSGARLVRVRQPVERDFRPDLAALTAAITPRTRAIVCATPNNPSGVMLNRGELAVIGELMLRHDLWLVADEVYAGLAPDGRVPGLAAELPDHVVTVSSLSKSHAMTGWRLGWVVGPKEFARHAEHLTMCMLFGLPGFIQDAAETALALSQKTEQRIRDYCAPRRELLFEALSRVPGLKPHAPEVGMFMLVDVTGTGRDGHRFAEELYAAERVSVVAGEGFGRETAGCVRVCFAAADEQLREAARRIERFCLRR
jgi:aspartate/methionine/tyrosine aminotransferase